MRWLGNWEPDTIYNYSEVVIHNNIQYIAWQPSENKEPPDPSVWRAISPQPNLPNKPTTDGIYQLKVLNGIATWMGI